MRILMCNSVHYVRGGVDRYYFDLSDLLSSHGHEVIPFSMQHPRNRPTEYARYFVSQIDFPSLLQQKTGLKAKLKVAERVIYSREARVKIERLLNDVKPDIVHVQEIDHELSPSILPPIREHGIPVVQTLHDYKLLCPNTNFYCRGAVCERCAGGAYYRAVLNKCKRNSRMASLLACVETYYQHLSRIYEKNVDLFFVPGGFLQKKLAESGFKARMVRLPIFVDIDRFQPVYEPSEYFLFFGRLVELKGVQTLFEALRHVNSSLHLYVAGEGELEESLKQHARQHSLSNITFLGYLDAESLIPMVQRAAFTVFPSKCYENYPVSILESFACGTPVIGSNIGGIPDIIQDGRSGLLFEPGNPQQLAERIQFLADHPEKSTEMGHNARQQVETMNHPEYHYRQIMSNYEQVLSLKRQQFHHFKRGVQ
jgi:glycosyltransferase involved in cell wall biosynthesis